MLKQINVLLLLFILAITTACQTTPPTPSETLTGGKESRAGWVDVDTGFSDTDVVGAYGDDADNLNQFGSDAVDLGGFNDPLSVKGGALDGQKGILAPVYFGFDQSAITPTEREKVKRAADYLLANPNAQLRIEGNCDWRGTAEYNLALGDRRATSVKQYLVDLNIAPKRITVLSHGSEFARQNGSETDMKNDRRADLIVVNNTL